MSTNKVCWPDLLSAAAKFIDVETSCFADAGVDFDMAVTKGDPLGAGDFHGRLHSARVVGGVDRLQAVEF